MSYGLLRVIQKMSCEFQLDYNKYQNNIKLI